MVIKMINFLVKVPTKIKFGLHAALDLKEILASLGAGKVMIITDKVIMNTPSFRAVYEKIEWDGFHCNVLSDTQADPPVEVVDQAAEIVKKNEPDVIVAIGGGSVIDTSKAVAMLLTNQGSVKDYLFGGSKSVENKPIPLICIPTTAGSGSEVTAASVITDNDRDLKLSVTHEYLAPLYAIVDPAMQIGMPVSITSSTGMDALTHAIEAYVCLKANPISDSFAEKAIELIGKNLRTAVHNPEDIDARSAMSVASVLGALAFSNASLGAVHGIAQAVGGIAHTPHGVANALLLPYVCKINLPGNLEKFAKIAELLGYTNKEIALSDRANLAVAAVKQLSEDIGIPKSLKQVGVKEEMFDTIVKNTMDYRLLPWNPVKIKEKDVYEILELAF